MTRADWQLVAEERLQAAATLLASGLWSSAFHLSGVALECGLKSCVVARVEKEPGLVYRERRFSEKCWTHSFTELVELAGLEGKRTAEMTAGSPLEANWQGVRSWRVESRYEMKSQPVAESLYNAIAGPDGVMAWVRTHW